MTAGDGPWERLTEGNRRFVDGKLTNPRRDTARRTEQAAGQTPFAVVLGCADSRVPPEVLFDQGIGDLFVIRVAGNAADAATVLGSIEYGVSVLDCRLVLVLGHEECGAVKAAVDVVTKSAVVPGHVHGVVEPVVPAVYAARSASSSNLVADAVRENVRRQVGRLKASEPVLAPLVRNGEVDVIGAEYSLRTGQVQRVD